MYNEDNYKNNERGLEDIVPNRRSKGTNLGLIVGVGSVITFSAVLRCIGNEIFERYAHEWLMQETEVTDQYERK